MVDDSSTQRITRLTPLAAIRGLIDSRVAPVAVRTLRPIEAERLTLAADMVAAARPPQPIALRDGFAVDAAAIADAGPYSPVQFADAPPKINAGEAMPAGTNAVLPFDAVAFRGSRAEATAFVSPGDGVLPAGGDALPAAPLRQAGDRLRAIDIAAAAAAGIEAVSVREPRIGIAVGGAAGNPVIDAALALLVRAVLAAGGSVLRDPSALDAALAGNQAEALIAVGGTGSGRQDRAVATLAKYGRVEAHGIAISPGETAAFGFVGERPVLLVPGRLDAALAAWLLIGRHLVAALAGGKVADTLSRMPLKRKVTSTIGLTELVPVSLGDGMAEPLGCSYLSLTALTKSQGWIVIPADSEGFAAGTQVAVMPWM